MDVQSPARARPVRGAPASRESVIDDRWDDRRGRFPAVPTARVSHPGSEVHRALADAIGRNLDLHGHLRRSVTFFFFVPLCAFLEGWIRKAGFLYLQGMRGTPPWNTRLGRFPPRSSRRSIRSSVRSGGMVFRQPSPAFFPIASSGLITPSPPTLPACSPVALLVYRACPARRSGTYSKIVRRARGT